MVYFSSILSLLALSLSGAVAVPLPGSSPNSMSDNNNMDHMGSTSTDQMSSSTTWSSPMSTSSGYGMNDGGNSMSYGGSSYGGDNMSYGSDSSSYPPSYTSTSSMYQPSPTYGSGSNNWGSNSNPYDDCVQQCQAKYPNSMSPGNDSPYNNSPDNSPPSQGSKTHVVYVAPTQGVLRYVPFAVNASVGDTVKFIWGANNHTVTKGSELTPCNKTSDSPFASGLQLKDFVFEQVVNDTNPVFFYCAVPNHCTKGMFGIINPPNALGSPSSVGSMMQNLTASNPNLSMMRSYTDNATMNSPGASQWGTNFDMSSIPQWAQQSFVENVFYTRLFLAANPDALQNGQVDAGLSGNPPVIPQDITQVTLNNSTDSGYGSSPGSPSSMSSSSTGVPTSTPTAAGNLSGNGAVSARSGVTVVLAAIAAGFFLL